MPDLTLQTVLGELFAQDGVGLANGFQAITGDRTEATHAQAGAGERLTINHRRRESEGTSDNTNFILKEKLDRLYKSLKTYIFR